MQYAYRAEQASCIMQCIIFRISHRFCKYAAPYQYQTPDQKPDPEMEMQALRNQAQILKSELDFIEKRLAEIKAGNAEQQT
jgi:hypothetical protein